MPTYEYECVKCLNTFEHTLTIEDRDIPTQTFCGFCYEDNTVRRIWPAAPTHFKGGGFYATDK